MKTASTWSLAQLPSHNRPPPIIWDLDKEVGLNNIYSIDKSTWLHGLWTSPKSKEVFGRYHFSKVPEEQSADGQTLGSKSNGPSVFHYNHLYCAIVKKSVNIARQWSIQHKIQTWYGKSYDIINSGGNEWMNEWCSRPWFCTCNAILGRGQPGKQWWKFCTVACWTADQLSTGRVINPAPWDKIHTKFISLTRVVQSLV